MTFFLVASWGILVLLSLVGWGRICGLLLRPGRRPSLGLAGAMGFAVSVFVGGLLGLLHLVIPWVLVAFIISGVGCWIADQYLAGSRSWFSFKRDSTNTVLAITLVCAAGCRYLASVKTIAFQPMDDVPAYIVFPVKMLQTGHFAPDPFSDRRMSGLGGQPWSQSMVLSLFDPTSINLFDHGIALILLLAIAGSWLRDIGAGVRFILGVQLVIALLYPNFVNCSSFITTSMLVLALFVLLLDRAHGIREALMLALIVSAICSLKTTSIPFCVAILTVYFVADAIKLRSLRPLIFAAGVAGLSLVLLAPWMVQMHLSSGTYLYPLFGRGNSLLINLAGTTPRGTLIALIALATLSAVGGVLILSCTWRLPARAQWGLTGAIFMISISPVIYLVGTKTGGVGWMRYSQPVLYGLLPLPFAAIWSWSSGASAGRARISRAAVGLLGFGMVFLSVGWARPWGPFSALRSEISSIKHGINWDPMVTDKEIQQAHLLQQAVPEGATLLTCIRNPSLLNFARNPAFINDHPGLAAPRPGLADPIQASAYRSFLLDHGIRYLAFSYGPASEQTAQGEASRYLWDRVCARRAFRFQNAVTELSENHRILYDDGVNRLIDLR